MITINAKLLHAVTKWTDHDHVRPALRCVLFDKNYAVACDGHRLVRIPVDTAGDRIAVDRDHLFAALAAHREARANGDVKLTLDDKRVRIDIDRASFSVPAGRPEDYPPYEKLMSTGTDGVPTGYYLNSKYLAAIDEVHVALGGGSSCGVKVVAWAADHLGAMRFEGAGGSEFLVMPMRG